MVSHSVRARHSNSWFRRSRSPLAALAALLFVAAAAPRAQAQGSLVSWGDDYNGQVSGTPAGYFLAVAAGLDHSVAIRTDGTLASWGWDSGGQVSGTPAGTFRAVAAGEQHSVAIRTDGTLVSWSDNSQGQLNGIPPGTFTAVSCGWWHNVALRTDGTLVGWGDNSNGQLNGTPSGTFSAVACGIFHNLGLRTNGTLAAWGVESGNGEVSLTPAGTYTAVFAGVEQSFAIRPDGTLALWGIRDFQPPGTFTAAAAVGLSYLVAIRTDGTLYQGGPGVPTGTYSAVAAGFSHLVAIATSNNRRPVANAGPDQSVAELAFVTLNGSGSTDPDSDLLAYQWRQVAGPAVTLSGPSGPTPTFTAPVVPLGGATLTFELEVRDPVGLTDTDTVDIGVANVNHAPVAMAGNDQTVAEASLVTLDATLSYDLDFDFLGYSWVQTGGTLVVLDQFNPRRPRFTAPPVGAAGETLTFRLTVDDGFETAHDSVSVLVENVNHDPAADAGADQTHAELSAVLLDGSASSDPDSDTLSYGWVQVSGPLVLLIGAQTATPGFDAPAVGPEGAALVFRLCVNDGYAGTGCDEVRISVQDSNSPPDCSLARFDVPLLWPLNHKMVPVTIIGVSDAENQSVAITILGVTQDEPTSGLGDGVTAVDAVIQGSFVLLRAERAGGGNGRVYGSRSARTTAAACASVRCGCPCPTAGRRTARLASRIRWSWTRRRRKVAPGLRALKDQGGLDRPGIAGPAQHLERHRLGDRGAGQSYGRSGR